VCGLPLKDLSTAFDADDGQNFMHFDCVMNRVAEKETLEPGDKIAYIGQGRFGVVHYANIHDTRHFSIKKIIEWDDKEKKSEWREEMADLYSRVK
jgi:hypothetical protein